MDGDLFYNIMDYSGNYYTLNHLDQLVTAANKEEAAVFTFAQANSRIGAGKKSSFYCMVQAEAGAQEHEDLPMIRELTYDELQDPVEKNVYSYNLSEIDWMEYLTHFTYIVSGMKRYREELTKTLSDIDKKICDILHYIELCETNENEAVDLIELLRVCRENRRDIKDELTRTEYFQMNLGTSANAAKASQALKSIKGLESRKYRPRKLDELFENCTMKHRRIEKADLQNAGIKMEERKRERGSVSTYRGEEIMTEERNYTPYDGKENDWLSFARQQAEFYRNAGQYIVNLQLTIQELDQEIESVLQETEDANCNVAQGYKVFKRLKELRLEKKARVQELGCLYALTDYVDCGALSDVCEESLSEIEDILDVRTEMAVEEDMTEGAVLLQDKVS